MSRVFAREVVRTAAFVFNVPVKELVGRRRDHAVAHPRNLTCRAIRALCPHASYPEIGRLFGRDHTTIVSNVAKTDALLAGKPALAEAYDRLLRHASAPAVGVLDAEIAVTEAQLADLVARRDALLTADTLTSETLALDTLAGAGDGS